VHVVAVANQKGGVGKSTLAVHLVWLSVERGHRTLLVDLDGQANSSRTFSMDCRGLTASSLFLDQLDPKARPMRIDSHTALIGADMDVNDIEGLPLACIERPAARLRGLHLPPDTVVVIDTPPNLGRRLLGALIAADAVVSPLTPNGYAIQGLTDLQQTILTVQERFNPRLRNMGILANMVSPRAGSHGRMLQALRQAVGDRLLPTVIAQRVAIADAIDRRRPVWRATKGGSALLAGREMRAACAHILDAVISR
jgi:chromosome partitioning protein